jgi:hypothetical protein
MADTNPETVGGEPVVTTSETAGAEGWKVAPEPEFDAEAESEETAFAQEAQTEEAETPAVEESAEPETESVPWDAVDWSRFEWDGNPENLPEGIKEHVYKRLEDTTMRGLHKWQNKKNEEWREKERQYLELLAKQPQPTPQTQEGPPPLDSSSEEAYASSLRRQQEWIAKQQAEAVRAELAPLLHEQQQKLQEYQAAMRVNRLRSKEGYTPAIEQKMEEALSEDQGLMMAAANSDRVLDLLFEDVRRQMEGASSANATILRAASAAKRTTDRPAGRGKTKTATPADKYAATLEEMAAETARELGLDLRDL